MTQERRTSVDRYFADLLARPDPALDGAPRANAAAGLPPQDVAPNRGGLLQLLARAVGARSILEVGTLGGYSTIWLARAVHEGGRLVTLEVDPEHAEVARGNLAGAGLAERTEPGRTQSAANG
ncbi:O-methyltransferase [uncultured Arthrobacter sp.]|uniref:O-methyltransferase n=1 Tax=uncultured Arthrobacter sp. TaxID=114050 RepID=UPI0025F862B2|nr:class I SAM-dependent methyltransferase [uncultured Arthrobacter sp.]